MTKKVKRYEIDMCSGNLFKKMMVFAIPLMLTGILQLLYNAADLIIVSNFSDQADALGAVGSTSALINLLINLFMGLSVGANVLVARAFATNNKDAMERVVHTSVVVSVLIGVILGIFGFLATDWMLKLMDNPIPLASTYLKIYFIGLPFNMLYNFAASILRGVGDTKRPLYFLSIAGVINVILNLIFVIVFHLGVAGVALATIISQLVSCVFIVVCLIKSKESYHLVIKKLKIYPRELLSMLRIGLPAGIQGSIFSISNVIIQSSVNSFGNVVVNGNSAAQSLEGFVYTSMNAIYHASLSFAGQNMGAKKVENIKKVLLSALALVTIIGVGMGGTLFLFGNQALKIYAKLPAEINVGYIRLHYLALPYFLCGIMDVTCGVIRGLGYAVVPMVVSIVGVCGLRLVWIFGVFKPLVDFANYNYLHLLYVSYPISWIITFSVLLICYFKIMKKVKLMHRVELV